MDHSPFLVQTSYSFDTFIYLFSWVSLLFMLSGHLLVKEEGAEAMSRIQKVVNMVKIAFLRTFEVLQLNFISE